MAFGTMSPEGLGKTKRKNTRNIYSQNKKISKETFKWSLHVISFQFIEKMITNLLLV